MRDLIRWILPVLLLANGLVMLLAPTLWYPVVPGVTQTGPYNQHFVRDIGAAYIACGAGLGWWAMRRLGSEGALIPVAVFLTLHMLVHLVEAVTGHHPGGDVVRDFVGVYVPALIACWLVWRNRAAA